jgi:hypothetical protein
MIALDTTSLSLLFIPGATVSRVGSTVPIKLAKERLNALVEKIASTNDQILIPTPVLSELMVKITPDQINELLVQLHGSVWFRVESFDAAAAVELGIRTAKAIAEGDKREGLADAPWTKIKFDRQIVAIAVMAQASEIISDDPHLKAIGDRWGIKVTSIEELPIPSEFIPPPLLAGLEQPEKPALTDTASSPEATRKQEPTAETEPV